MTLLHRPLPPLATVVALAALLLGGCAPAPSPMATPTPAFTSEAEAFAAAEEVYRAYLSAVAARAWDAPDADPQSYLSGRALSGDIETQRALAEAGLKVLGESQVSRFSEVSADIGGAVAFVVADICIDLRGSRVINDRGEDITPIARPDESNLRIEFAGSEDSLLITSSTSTESEC